MRKEKGEKVENGREVEGEGEKEKRLKEEVWGLEEEVWGLKEEV